MRLKRVRAGQYESIDGIWSVWYSDSVDSCRREQVWYVNHKDYDETMVLGGFRTKWLAVQWLKETLTEDWWK